MALVLALREIETALPYRFLVGHVNHALRGKASAQDEVFVRRLSARCGWPVRVKQAPLRIRKGNLEEGLRVKRYKALFQMAEAAGCAAIFTAHTLDDQAETILMNLLRGTGVAGLGGIQEDRPEMGSSVHLCRPFLSLSKKDIVAWLKKRKAPYRKDASNQNRRFLRNWLRLSVIPLLESRAPGVKERLAQTAEMIRDEESFWESEMARLETRLLRKSGAGQLLDFEGLLRYSRSVQRRFLRRIAGKDLLTFSGVERLRFWMGSPPTSGRVFQLRKGWIAERLSKSKGSPSAKHFWIGPSHLR